MSDKRNSTAARTLEDDRPRSPLPVGSGYSPPDTKFDIQRLKDVAAAVSCREGHVIAKRALHPSDRKLDLQPTWPQHQLTWPQHVKTLTWLQTTKFDLQIVKDVAAAVSCREGHVIAKKAALSPGIKRALQETWQRHVKTLTWLHLHQHLSMQEDSTKSNVFSYIYIGKFKIIYTMGIFKS